MKFFTSFRGGNSRRTTWMAVALLFFTARFAMGQMDTNSTLPGPGEISTEARVPATNAPATNAPPAPTAAMAETTSQSAVVPTQIAAPPQRTIANDGSGDPTYASFGWTSIGSSSIFGAIITLASMGGFLLYLCGLTRAKNSGHTSTLLLVGVLFALTGYWIGGFAVQTGGIGDAHAALAQEIPSAEKSTLDHELGPVLFGHHWGLMGSAGFFLATDDPTNENIAALFLVQAAFLGLAAAAALGAALERGRLLGMAICAFLIGVLIYPFFANWVWGGGWLAELGREFDLGHGFIDLGGSAVVHETAGTLALVFAVVLGTRHGRFARSKIPAAIPGHNVPFMVLGSIVLLLSWMATNALSSANLAASPLASDTTSLAAAVSAASGRTAVAAINTLLAAAAGLLVSFIQATWQRRRPEPARLCRGLLGGAVASAGGAGLIDPWAAFLIGGAAALLVQGAMTILEQQKIDDPVGAASVHGVGGAWGVLAVGLFANGTSGYGLNGIATPVRGLLFGGAWHQLAAQAIGAVTCFIVVYLLGLACVSLVRRIVGLRVDRRTEIDGLDMSEVGALGYQGDVETED